MCISFYWWQYQTARKTSLDIIRHFNERRIRVELGLNIYRMPLHQVLL